MILTQIISHDLGEEGLFPGQSIVLSTNGYQGGDGGHGGFLSLEFNTPYDGGFDIDCDHTPGKIMITIRGDWEIGETIKALRKFVHELEKL
jgi:hypothetical protein